MTGEVLRMILRQAQDERMRLPRFARNDSPCFTLTLILSRQGSFAPKVASVPKVMELFQKSLFAIHFSVILVSRGLVFVHLPIVSHHLVNLVIREVFHSLCNTVISLDSCCALTLSG